MLGCVLLSTRLLASLFEGIRPPSKPSSLAYDIATSMRELNQPWQLNMSGSMSNQRCPCLRHSYFYILRPIHTGYDPERLIPSWAMLVSVEGCFLAWHRLP